MEIVRNKHKEYEINGECIYLEGGASCGMSGDDWKWNGTYSGTIRRTYHKTNHNYYFHINSGRGKKSFDLFVALAYSNGRDILLDSGLEKTLWQIKERIVKQVSNFEHHSFPLEKKLNESTYPVFIINGGNPEIVGVYHTDVGRESDAYMNQKFDEYFYYHRGVPNYIIHKKIYTLEKSRQNGFSFMEYDNGYSWRSSGGYRGVDRDILIPKMIELVNNSKIPNLKLREGR